MQMVTKITFILTTSIGLKFLTSVTMVDSDDPMLCIIRCRRPAAVEGKLQSLETRSSSQPVFNGFFLGG
jgi:hypothetical protein